MRLSLYIVLAAILLACTKNQSNENKKFDYNFTIYSEQVMDTFFITVQAPREYFSNPGKKYPVAILLDGNFFSPMMSSVLHQYETAGLLKPMILVSIGYKSFQTMDSLRVRDYLYPKASPCDEMNAVGGGQRFHSFIAQTLLPKIDTEFRTEKESRCLLGHSFGGYFVLYSLMNQLENETSEFKTFISACPTLWYHDFYLNKIPQQLNAMTDEKKLNLFLTVGSLEDSTWSVKPVEVLTSRIQALKKPGLNFQSNTYSHLDHMDVGVLTFTKGLQEFSKP
jgi:predicted alpha/beta superfamily hydrolase